jgi:hypothetical protein
LLKGYTLAVLAVSAGLCACARGGNATSAQALRPSASPMSLTPGHPITRTPAPTYLAQDYTRAGRPPLTVDEIGMIRDALAKVKPCQRAFLLYAFPSNPDFGLPLVLFFKEPDPTQVAHVFGTTGVYIQKDGEVFVTPIGVPRVPSSISFDVEHTGCSPGEHVHPWWNLSKTHPSN